MDGWVGQSVINIKKYVDLPENAKKYIEFIENFISIPIEIISNGADRDAIIYKVST